MAVLTVNNVTRALTVDPNAGGLVAASGGGDSFPNTGVETVIFKNASGGSITITEVIQSTVDGQAPASKTVVLPAGQSCMLGGYPVSIYNDANGRMNFTYSGVTSLSVGVFKGATS